MPVRHRARRCARSRSTASPPIRFSRARHFERRGARRAQNARSPSSACWCRSSCGGAATATNWSPASGDGVPARRCSGATIPAIVRGSDDRNTLEVAIIENLQRENLNPLEEAAGFAASDRRVRLHAGRASRVGLGKSRPAIANALRLLALPDPIKAMLARRTIERPARPRAAGAARSSAWRWPQRAVDEGLTVRALERARPRRPPLRSTDRKRTAGRAQSLARRERFRIPPARKIRHARRARARRARRTHRVSLRQRRRADAVGRSAPRRRLMTFVPLSRLVTIADGRRVCFGCSCRSHLQRHNVVLAGSSLGSSSRYLAGNVLLWRRRRRTRLTRARPRCAAARHLRDRQRGVRHRSTSLARALDAGVRIVQYRAKSGIVAATLAASLRGITRERGRAADRQRRRRSSCARSTATACISVPTTPASATLRAVRANLAQSVSSACRAARVEEARPNRTDGADYLGVGSVYATPSKDDAGEPIGIEGLTRIAPSRPLPVAAIGGITRVNVIERAPQRRRDGRGHFGDCGRRRSQRRGTRARASAGREP